MATEEKLVLEGGKLKLLTQGRQISAKSQGGVVVDYLRFTVHDDLLFKVLEIPADTSAQDLARFMSLRFAQLLGYRLGMDRPGRDYYEFTTTIENEFDAEVASVSAGGDSQRGTVCFTLKGEGCTFAAPGWEKRVYEFFKDLQPKITRVDLARDFYKKEVTIPQAISAYEDHAFSYQRRLPSITQHGDWLHGHSRTFQVGKRDSGKLCRIYEKGHQYRLMDDPWVRVEVELRSVNRVIPWEALVEAGSYFAGSYEFCNLLIHHHVVSKVPTGKKVAEASVDRVWEWVNRVVAPTVSILAACTPDLDWVASLACEHKNRRTPRGLRGLTRMQIQQAVTRLLGSPNPGIAVASGL